MRVFTKINSLAQRRVRAVGSLLTLTVVSGCLDLNPNVTACTVTVAPSSISISVNQSSGLTATAFDCKGNSISRKTISYSSANAGVATVTATGQVIAVAVGSTTVSAVADGKSATTQVTVTPEGAASVVVSPLTATLRRTNTRQFSAIARNAQSVPIQGATFRWSSSNSSIVSIDATGRATALAAGTATVIADIGGVLGSASIIVTELPIGSCSLSPSTFKVTTLQSVQPTLTLRDTSNTVLATLGRPVVWTSENENVAVVSATGFITTRRAGTARVTASSVEYPSVVCAVSVEAVDPRIAQVVITPRTGSLRIGIPRVLTAALLDSTNTLIGPGRIVSWTSSTPTIAQISQAGIVTGIALGTARVIATSEGVADTVSFPVTRVPVSTITVSPLQAAIQEGRTVQINPTVTDSTGTVVTDRLVEWLTSDPSRATVSSTGLVSAIAPGNVLITATSENRAAQASIIIQQTPADSITTPATTLTVKIGTVNQTAFSFTVIDANGNTLRNRTVVISNSAPGLLSATTQTVGSQVNLLGLAPGSATLTLQVLNALNQAEGKATTVTVTVTP